MLGRTQTEDKKENRIVNAVIVPNCCIGTNIEVPKNGYDGYDGYDKDAGYPRTEGMAHIP